MLKKLLTGCLTIAMIGAFSAGVSAETTVKWTGNVEGTWFQQTYKLFDADAVTSMDMASSADVDLVATAEGDTWTGTAYADIDFSEGDTNAQTLGVDDVYVKMSKEGLAVSFGVFDPVGIFQGKDYVGETDGTSGGGNDTGSWAADVLADNYSISTGIYLQEENGYVQVSLPDVGLDIFLGTNTMYTDSSSYGDMTYGVKFKKSFGALALGLQYVAVGTTRNENASNAITEEHKFDGLSASDIDLAVTYTLDKMAFTLNYGMASMTTGVADDEATSQTVMEFVFDMGLSDTMGLSFVYDMISNKDDDRGDSADQIDVTNMLLSFKMMTDSIDHYIAYESETVTEADWDDNITYTKLSYTMQVNF